MRESPAAAVVCGSPAHLRGPTQGGWKPRIITKPAKSSQTQDARVAGIWPGSSAAQHGTNSDCNLAEAREYPVRPLLRVFHVKQVWWLSERLSDGSHAVSRETPWL